MSENTSSPLQITPPGLRLRRALESVPDSRWLGMRDARQSTEVTETSNQEDLQSSRQDLRTPAHVPTDALLLASAGTDTDRAREDSISGNTHNTVRETIFGHVPSSSELIASHHDRNAVQTEGGLVNDVEPTVPLTDRDEERRDNDDLSDEAINAYLQRNRTSTTLQSHISHRDEIWPDAHRNHETQNNEVNVNNQSMLNGPPTIQGVENGQNRGSESASGRPSSARRDLERALRDYRVARRALRSHVANESGSPTEHNAPTYAGILAQLGEQNSNNRNRMRARGQSRSSILERTDAIVDRIAGAAGVGQDVWRSDDDNDTVTAPIIAPRINSNQENGNLQTPPDRAVAATVQLDAAAIPGPSLRPTISAISDLALSASREIRNFHRDFPRRERNIPRADQDHSLILPVNAIDPYRHNPIQFADNQNHARDGRPIISSAKSRAKNVMKYLSKLKKFGNDGEKSLALAKDLGIDSITDSLVRETEVELPLHIRELPQPPYSSWLVPGMEWRGVQKGGFGKPDSDFRTIVEAMAAAPLFEDTNISAEDRILHLRAMRHRERVRAEREAQEQEHLGGQSTLSRVRDETRGMLHGINNRVERMETLADVETHLTLLLHEEERRLNDGHDRGWRVSGIGFQARGGPAPTAETKENEDKWPVKVTIHEVNWKKMKVSGTMIASQIPVRRPSVVVRGDNAANTAAEGEKEKENEVSSMGMETFFDGEIIDFHTHELETVSDKAGYKTGGINTDLKYWSRIGPFKEDIKKKVQSIKEKKAVEFYERLGISGTLDEQRAEYRATFREEPKEVEEIDKEELASIFYGAMADFLSSRKWIEKAIGEGGWIFMRWKERCFIDPPESSSQSNNVREHSRARTLLHRPNVYTTDYTDANHHEQISASGLTIRGFYYVAMNRMSGKIEALYYDSGSQPFQELLIQPIGYGNPENGDGNNLGQIGFKYDVGSFQLR